MEKLKEKLYHLLPFFFQNIAITIFGIHWYIRRYGGVFKSELKKCKERQNFTRKEWHEWQEIELRKLLLHAFKYVPYYTKSLGEVGLTETNINSFKLTDIKNIPILEKRDFRKFCDSEMLATKQESNGIFSYTSGSSGTPLKIKFSKRMHQKYFGIYESNVRNWAGINYKMSRGVFGGRRILKEGISNGPYYRYNYIEKQLYFSAYHISRKTIKDYIEALNKYNVDYLEGYSSSIFFLARFIEESGLIAPKLKAILGSTDKMTSEMRDTFRRVFQCEAFDSYNGVDICNLISECEHHRLHIVPDVGIVEVINEKGEICQPGEAGELVSTGLLNYDQPLIRYKIGDIVRLSENQTCPCGRNMTVVDEIIGRIEDVVIGSDGREMRRFNRVFTDIKSVIEGQIIQHGLTEFEIKLVTFYPPTKDEIDTIKQRIFAQLGKIELNIHVVDSIPRGPNGKFKAVISHASRKNHQNDYHH